jgi:hypothetical protein
MDWHWIGDGLTLDWWIGDWLTLDWRIDDGLTLDRTGLVTD